MEEKKKTEEKPNLMERLEKFGESIEESPFIQRWRKENEMYYASDFKELMKENFYNLLSSIPLKNDGKLSFLETIQTGDPAAVLDYIELCLGINSDRQRPSNEIPNTLEADQGGEIDE